MGGKSEKVNLCKEAFVHFLSLPFIIFIEMATALFDSAWFEAFKQNWNAELKMTEPLAGISFCSRIAYGFQNEVREKKKTFFLLQLPSR